MSPVYKILLWSKETLSLPCQKGGKKPNWTQKLSFERKKGPNVLKIEIWDENKYNEKDQIGSNYISLDNYGIFQRKKVSEWVDIFYENKKSGKVLISFEFSQ